MLEAILDKLEKVKVIGKETWACCPVHNEKNPSMSLREVDGKIIAHCFACLASGDEIAKALGLPPSVLFMDDIQRRSSIPRKAFELAQEDLYFIDLFEKQKESGGRVTWNEHKRYKLAKQRSKLLEPNDI